MVGGPREAECLWCRSTAIGDWCGRRSHLADNGITFTGDVTQFYQGVTGGGLRQRFRYGGHADYVFDFDMGKVAGVEGMLIKIRGESQFGQFINRDTGAILAEKHFWVDSDARRARDCINGSRIHTILVREVRCFCR